MNEKEVVELIKQMSGAETISKDGIYTNEGSPSWKAYRNAERLTDVSAIPILNSLLGESKDRETRENIYFILGKIGENTGDKRVVTVLLQSLEEETNKYLKGRILDQLAGQKNVESLIITFITDKRAAIRQSAIQALRSCKSSDAEGALIEVITRSNDEYDLTYANEVLSEVGTEKSIPYLVNLLNHPNGDVKCSALWTLTELGNTSLLPVFLEALNQRSVNVKSHALLAIKKHGNEMAIGPVIARIKTILSRERTVESDDLITGLEFLISYKENTEEIQKLFEWIRTKKWRYLFEEERVFITANS
ncbi:HEAT repeat domain-containing protein [Guptibacillus hwajinpoensis]|uniref:HEAT repeat protein n=1 Tax=Guptibacillus hwajinpoensis TaxID=208199 RepID=A0ABU0K3P6_9BACL|nr:HEAT repeat domain-containing protein [Alkalihalobacillus hemicentroti]MDQ0483978.1 HEAT repeat protein [Alkalihalobacillus hemicentroti]